MLQQSKALPMPETPRKQSSLLSSERIQGGPRLEAVSKLWEKLGLIKTSQVKSSSQVFVYSDYLWHKRRGVYKNIKNSVNKISNCSQSLKQQEGPIKIKEFKSVKRTQESKSGCWGRQADEITEVFRDKPEDDQLISTIIIHRVFFSDFY